MMMLERLKMARIGNSQCQDPSISGFSMGGSLDHKLSRDFNFLGLVVTSRRCGYDLGKTYPSYLPCYCPGQRKKKYLYISGA